jgi:hypothetical protein
VIVQWPSTPPLIKLVATAAGWPPAFLSIAGEYMTMIFMKRARRELFARRKTRLAILHNL